MEHDNKNVFDELIVVKRSGQRVNFNSAKIAIAIKNAFDQVMPINSEKKINKIYEDVVSYITDTYKDRKTINVEDIQDIIETKLKENNCKEVYLAFSDYRIRRAASRQAFGIKQQHKFAKAIERIVNDTKENKYIDTTPSDILLNFGKTISCEYTKTYVLDNKLVRAHEEGSIYIHNLDYFNLGKLSSTHLLFNDVIEKKFPSNFIKLAIDAKKEIDGEIAIDNFDEMIKPIIIKEFKNYYKNIIQKYLSITSVKDYINIDKLNDVIDKFEGVLIDNEGLEEFILNKKVQDIFDIAMEDTNLYIRNYLESNIEDILMSLNNTYLENKKYSISIGNANCYETILINNVYLDVLRKLEILNNVTTIFKVTKETDSELLNKVSELILVHKNMAFAFPDTSYNKNEYEVVDYFSNGKRVFENPVYETFGTTGRMIVASISINMGRLGLKYQNKDINEFYTRFDELLELSKVGLVNIFEIIGDKTKKNYQIIFKNNIIDDDKLEEEQKIRKIIKKGVLNIELVGLKECVSSLNTNSDIEKKLLLEILEYANNKVKSFIQDTKLNFIISETTKHRPLKKLMGLDKAIFGTQKNITDKDMYGTVDELFEFKKDIKEDFKYIGMYQKYFTGGNVFKICLNKTVKVKNILEIINLALDNDVGFIKLDVGK